MSTEFTHEQYLSPFAWRYGSAEMRGIWSEIHKKRLWRRIWVALAAAEAKAGIVSEEEMDDIRQHQDEIDIARAEEIESEIRHDLMAEVRTYAEQCPVGGGKIHLGATSMDIEDNADALRLREALALIEKRLRGCLSTFAAQIEKYATLPAMGYTHIQAAEPTTVGYRLAQYAQDFLEDLKMVERTLADIRGKGIKGAVGTAASYDRLLAGTGVTPGQLEEWVMAELELPAFPVATQTYPRKQDWMVLNALAGIAASAHKFAFDLRILQSVPFSEWSEPFGKRQVGSSAMPFKRNPVTSETTCSLARYVSALPVVLWHDAANSLLERTLDDSANRRVVLPDAFLATDHILTLVSRLIGGLNVQLEGISKNMDAYGPFAATEAVLMEAVKAGANRQEMHEILREQSMQAWSAVQKGEPNPLCRNLQRDSRLTRYLSGERIAVMMDASDHVGDAAKRAAEFARALREYLENNGGKI